MRTAVTNESILIEMGECPFCGGGKRTPCFATYQDGKKCFSCGYYKTYDAQRQAFTALNATPKVSREFSLPSSTGNPSHFHQDTLAWLYKYYVFEKLIKKHGIRYIEQDELGFSLLFSQSSGKFVQRRYFPDKTIRNYGKKRPHIVKCNNQKTLVLCEDYISAIRAGEHANTMCLFGTSLDKEHCSDIVSSYNHIVIWLDSDAPGQSSAKKLISYLTYLSKKLHLKYPLKYSSVVKITNVVTELDPKCYSDEQIKDTLHEII